MTYTIKQLRQKGYKVRVIHQRNYRTVQKMDGVYKEILSQGGSTTIEITTPDKQNDVSGKSVCSSEDNFNRRVGNAIALGRAIEQLKIKGIEI
jgi:biotin operon repressor